MEYRIPESYGLYIDDSLKIRQDMDCEEFEIDDEARKKNHLSIIENKIKEKSLVRLYINDILSQVELGWLYRYSKNRLLMPDGYEDYFSNYVFKSLNSKDKKVKIYEEKLNIDYVILFKNPIYISKSDLDCMFPDENILDSENDEDPKDERLRLIPEFPWYAISKAGEMYNIETGQRINPSFVKHSVTKKNTFPIVTFSTEFTENEVTTRSLHKLVAQVWVENDDWINKKYVLFKDGNILNYDAENLYWASKEERAFIKEKREKDAEERAVKVYDSLDKVIFIFESINDAYSKLKIKKTIFNKHDMNGYLRFIIADKRYEIRYLDDCLPFIQEKNPELYNFIIDNEEGINKEKIYIRTIDANNGDQYFASLASTSILVGMPQELVIKNIIDDKIRRGWHFSFATKDMMDNNENSIIIVDEEKKNKLDKRRLDNENATVKFKINSAESKIL